MERKASPSKRVIRAVAQEEGIDIAEIEPPLYDAIDPDALDSLFRDTTGELTFTYMDYTIQVTSSGTVSIE